VEPARGLTALISTFNIRRALIRLQTSTKAADPLTTVVVIYRVGCNFFSTAPIPQSPIPLKVPGLGS